MVAPLYCSVSLCRFACNVTHFRLWCTSLVLPAIVLYSHQLLATNYTLYLLGGFKVCTSSLQCATVPPNSPQFGQSNYTNKGWPRALLRLV